MKQISLNAIFILLSPDFMKNFRFWAENIIVIFIFIPKFYNTIRKYKYFLNIDTEFIYI